MTKEFGRSFAILMFGYLLILPLAGRAAPPEFGRVAPEITAESWYPSGRPATLASQRGKFVLLEFWRTGCTHCKKSFPVLAEWQALYGDRLAVIGLTRETPEKALPFLKEQGTRFPVGMSTPLAADWDVKKVPLSYLFDPDGRLIWMDRPPQMEPILRNAMAGKLPAYLEPATRLQLETQLASIEERSAHGDHVRAWSDTYRLRQSFPMGHPTYERARDFMVELIKLGLQKKNAAEALIGKGRIAEAQALLRDLTRDYEGSLLETEAKTMLRNLANPAAQ